MNTTVMFSGGMDSTTALCQAIADGAETLQLIHFMYGSTHEAKETQAATNVVRYLKGIGFHSFVYVQMHMDPNLFKGVGSALMGESAIPDEEYHDIRKVSPSKTVVPFRNAVFISMATAMALSAETPLLYFAAHASDARGYAYPDCTPEFVGAMSAAVHLGTLGAVRLVTPFQWMTKADIVNRAALLEAPLEITWSCYRGGDYACGECPTCKERIQAFRETDYADPIKYANNPAFVGREWPGTRIRLRYHLT